MNLPTSSDGLITAHIYLDYTKYMELVCQSRLLIIMELYE